MTSRLLARWNGEVIGERRSPRPYILAIIGHRNEVTASANAYAYTATKSDESNFEYRTWIATAEPGSPYPKQGFRFTHTAGPEEVADAKAEIEGGFEAFVGRIRQRMIDGFEQAKEAGEFKPGVLAWSMSERAARAAVGQWSKGHIVLGLAPVEVAEKARKKSA